MIKPRGEARAVGVVNDVSYFDPGSDGVLTPMMNGKTMEDKVWGRINEPPDDKTNCAPNEYSDQPGHPPSLVRVFAVRSMGN